MKQPVSIYRPISDLLLLCGAFIQIHTGSAATLSVTPPIVSNTYAGLVQLDIGALTNTEQVIVRKYLDLNGNGVIDPGEPLIDTFKISDGGAMVIGGVTNISVPFDRNPAGGAINIALSVAPAFVIENLVGKSIYQVVSPSGRFSPVTAPFAVTNAILGQSITGVVYSNEVAPFANAVVVVQDQQANSPIGGAVADANGVFSIAVPPGVYTLIATFPNYYYDSSAAASVVLTNGMTATNNVNLLSASESISGSVYDASTSNGLAGVLVTLQSGGLFAVAFTDTSGNYSAGVTPSFWKIDLSKERLSRRAYLVNDQKLQVDATAGSVTNANLPLVRGNALFYGRLTDNSGVPYANVEISGGCQLFDGKGVTDQNGYYAVAVLGDGTNFWVAQATDSKNSLLANFVVNTFFAVTVSANQTFQENFIALPTTGRISGRVQDNSGASVSGVVLQASASINGNNYQAVEVTTDNSGNYSIAVASGQWSLQFLTGGFSDNLDAHGFVDVTAPHYVSIPPTNATQNLTVYPIGTPSISQPQHFSGNQFGFNIMGASNVSYTVQVSTNLASTNWANLFSLVLTNNSVFVMDPHATNSSRYYRVKKN